MLMGMITTSQVRRFAEDSLIETFADTFDERRFLLAETTAVARYEQIKAQRPDTNKVEETDKPKRPASTAPEKTKRASAPLNFNHDRPPNNSRLNLYLALCKEDPAYEALAVRYLTQTFGPEAERVFAALKRERDKMTAFTFPDDLCTLELPEEIRDVFYSWMPEFLHKTSFDTKLTFETRRVNLLFACPALIEAVVGNSDRTAALIALRDQMWERIEAEEEDHLGRKKIKDALKEGAATILPETELFQLFDYSLGKPGTVIFVKDRSGSIERQKLAFNHPGEGGSK